MHKYPQIPEYSEMPELSYRSRIAFRILQREAGFSIPDEDDIFIDWLAKESDSDRYLLMTPGYDRSYFEDFVLQRIYSKFRERMGDDICYGFFSECLDAATRSYFAGPAPYCGFAIYSPFYRVCVNYGKSAPGYGMPWDRYSYNVASFFMRGLSEHLTRMPYHDNWPSDNKQNQIWNQLEEMGFKFVDKTGSVIMAAPKRTLHKGDDNSKEGNNGLRDQKRNQ